MTVTHYQPVRGKSGDSITYGIAFYDGGVCVGEIPDISDNKTDIDKLTALLNEEAVEPCHFQDVVEDYLTDFEV